MFLINGQLLSSVKFSQFLNCPMALAWLWQLLAMKHQIILILTRFSFSSLCSGLCDDVWANFFVSLRLAYFQTIPCRYHFPETTKVSVAAFRILCQLAILIELIYSLNDKVKSRLVTQLFFFEDFSFIWKPR